MDEGFVLKCTECGHIQNVYTACSILERTYPDGCEAGAAYVEEGYACYGCGRSPYQAEFVRWFVM